MKSSAIMYIGLLFIILTVGIISVLTMKSSYADVMRDNLDESILYSVKMLQTDRDKVIYSDDKSISDVLGGEVNLILDDELSVDDNGRFKESFIRYLTSNLDSRITDLDVSIYGADVQNGVMSVEVTAYFKYPTGKVDSVSSYKTVILDKVVK